jgi:hypothetical protein
VNLLPPGEGRPFRALARTFLRLSLRGSARQAYGGRYAAGPAGLLWLVALYLVVGVTTLSVVPMHPTVFSYALLVDAMTFVMVGLSFTAEAGDALFNPAERDVLGHRPVTPRTLLAAKSAGLLGFGLVLAAALNLAPLVIGGRLGDATWFAVAHVLTTGLLTTFAAALVVLAYGMAVRLVGQERFDDVAAWAQVALAVLFVAAGQGLSRLAMATPTLERAPLVAALPPAWFAALDVVLGGGSHTPALLAVAALAPLATALASVVALGRLGADHGEALARVGGAPAASRRALRRLPTLAAAPLRWWVADPVERASFRLATAYLRRDRETRLRLYPSLVVFALFPLTALTNPGPAAPFVPLASVCLLGMLPAVALESLRVSSHPSAAELFGVVPLAGTGPVFHGVRKAAIWFVAPAVAVALALSTALAPQGIGLAAAGLIALPTFTLLPGLFGDYLPLGLPPLRGRQTRRNAALMLVSTAALLALIAVSGIAWHAGRLPLLLAIETVALVAAHRALGGAIARRPRREV